MATKKLRCWVGLHHWVRHVNDEGKTFSRCANCDKFRDTPDVGMLSSGNFSFQNR